jgi:hypothetical protein
MRAKKSKDRESKLQVINNGEGKPIGECDKLPDGHSLGCIPGDEMKSNVNTLKKGERMDNPETQLQVVASQKLSAFDELAYAQVTAKHENCEAVISRNAQTPTPKPLKLTDIHTDYPSNDEDPIRRTLGLGDVDADSLRETLGIGDIDFAKKLLAQVTMGSPKLCGELLVDVNGSLAALRGIGPRDGIEAMLGVQMIALHNHTLESLRKASRPEVPNNVRDVYANRAVKFARTFSSHVDALNEYRNRATTNVLVVHQAADATVRRTGPHGTAATLEGEDEKAG